METKWTEGEWRTGKEDAPGLPYDFVKCGDFYIASAHDGLPNGQAEANARLMAASPDLYEALAKLTEMYVQLAGSGDCGFWNPEEDPEVIAARSALLKASDGGA